MSISKILNTAQINKIIKSCNNYYELKDRFGLGGHINNIAKDDNLAVAIILIDIVEKKKQIRNRKSKRYI